jgi:hypothetical protein
MVAGQSRRLVWFAALDRIQNLAVFGNGQLFGARLADKIEMKPREPREERLAQLGEHRIAGDDGDAMMKPAVNF